MLRTAVIIFIACCALSALSLAEEADKSRPAATGSAPGEFDSMSSKPTTKPTTTTTATTKPTTKPTTTTTATTKPTTKPTTTTTAPTTTTTATTAPTTTTTATTKPTTKPTTTTTATTKPTTKPTTTTTATTKPTTKPTTTTTATTKPTTKPTTTTTATTKPTTKPTTTTTSTTKPTTTTASPTTKPPTNMTAGDYNVTNDKKEICVRAQMALRIRQVSQKANGTFVVQPLKSSAEGNCDDTTANINITFPEGYINFTFSKSVANNTVFVSRVSFNVISSGNAAALKANTNTYTADNSSLHLFPAKIGHSYSCKAQTLTMGNGLFLDVNQDRTQAFNMTKGAFGSSDPCPADQPNYRVAIGVGIALLVLIVVVLVAYLVTRRRRTDGYQSL